MKNKIIKENQKIYSVQIKMSAKKNKRNKNVKFE